MIKAKHNPIFNPAAFGLIIALAAFHAGDIWWASSSYNLSGAIVSLTPLLAVPAYLSKRITAGLAFIITSIIIGVIMSGGLPLSTSSLISVIFSANYLLGMIMVGDPKTSPAGTKGQVAYGVLVAALIFSGGYLGMSYPILISLLTANLLFTLYRNKHLLLDHRSAHPKHAAQ